MYILDYLRKRRLLQTAAAFQHEAKLADGPVGACPGRAQNGARHTAPRPAHDACPDANICTQPSTRRAASCSSGGASSGRSSSRAPTTKAQTWAPLCSVPSHETCAGQCARDARTRRLPCALSNTIACFKATSRGARFIRCTPSARVASNLVVAPHGHAFQQLEGSHHRSAPELRPCARVSDRDGTNAAWQASGCTHTIADETRGTTPRRNPAAPSWRSSCAATVRNVGVGLPGSKGAVCNRVLTTSSGVVSRPEVAPAHSAAVVCTGTTSDAVKGAASAPPRAAASKDHNTRW